MLNIEHILQDLIQIQCLSHAALLIAPCLLLKVLCFEFSEIIFLFFDLYLNDKAK